MIFPERRQHIRIVTLRNFAWLTLSLLLAFALVSLRSELRGRHRHDYGRLAGHQIETKPIERKPVEAVEESAAPATAPAEPMQVIPVDAPPVQTPATLSAQVVPPPRGDARFAIVGGPEGVTVVQQTQNRPKLRGGFGR